MSNGLSRSDTICKGLISSFNEIPDKVFIKSAYKDGIKTGGWNSLTWHDLYTEIRFFASGLKSLGFNKDDRLALFSQNRPRWIIANDAILFLDGIFIPIYPTTGENGLTWILTDSNTKGIVIGEQAHLDKILAIQKKTPSLEVIITMTPGLNYTSPIVRTWEEIIELGKQQKEFLEEFEEMGKSVLPDSVASIIYTSGTTGLPKGVMLTHSNFVTQSIILPEFPIDKDDIWLSHLPLCHSFGFSGDLLLCGDVGGTLAMLDSLDSDEIRRGLTEIRPTLMSSVPRLWEKIYIRIQQTINEQSPARKKMFLWFIENSKKLNRLKEEKKNIPLSLKLKNKVAESFFSKVKKKVGLDRFKLCFTGGGPISPEIIIFFKALGINLFEGYGLTETAPVINVNTPANNKIGSVGRPLINAVEKIDEDGEILIKGPMVMKGYLNNKQATDEVFTPDGYFRTGDIGYIDGDGFLFITDRKKEIIVTSGGKNIAPQYIENMFNTDPYVEQICVIGERRKFISALVSLNFENIQKWAEERKIPFNNIEDMAQSSEVLGLINERVNLVNNKLGKFEQIKKFKIVAHEFSEETGELTPTLKKKRRVIDEKYKDIIDQIYQ